MYDELSVLSELKNRFRPVSDKLVLGIGDDCAALRSGEGMLTLYSTDSLMEGVHFSTSYMRYEEIARKAVSVSVSDVAAMGGVPRFFLSTIGLPKSIQKKCVDEIFSGFEEASDFYGLELIGGNLIACDKLLIDITVIGDIDERKLLRRSGARPGDLVFVTGHIGDSARGLELLKSGKAEADDYFQEKHKNPVARVKTGRALADEGVATSMIDISDGFLIDLGRITAEHGLGADIFSEKIPFSENFFTKSNSYQEQLLSALSGGEDYELLFTADPGGREKISDISKNQEIKISEVGTVTETRKINLYGRDNKIINFKRKGFVHHWN